MARHSRAIVHGTRDLESKSKTPTRIGYITSHTLDIHSNEAWNYYDYILIKNRSGTIKSAHYKVELMTSIQKKMLGYVAMWLR